MVGGALDVGGVWRLDTFVCVCVCVCACVRVCVRVHLCCYIVTLQTNMHLVKNHMYMPVMRSVWIL